MRPHEEVDAVEQLGLDLEEVARDESGSALPEAEVRNELIALMGRVLAAVGMAEVERADD